MTASPMPFVVFLCLACRRCPSLSLSFLHFVARACHFSYHYVCTQTQQKHPTTALPKRLVSFTFWTGGMMAICIRSRVGSPPDTSGGGHTTSTSGIGSHDRGTSTGCTDTPTPHRVHTRSFEHRRVLQHIWDDEKSNHAAPDVDLIQLRYATIAAGDCDVS